MTREMPKVENWKVKDLTTAIYGGIRSSSPKALVIPTYQRDYVWKLPRRRDLVMSFRNGWPVGAIIVRSTGNSIQLVDGANQHSVPTYEVIDGLQRSTSLILHSLFPFEILDLKTLNDELLRSGISISTLTEKISELSGSEISEKAVRQSILDWTHGTYKRRQFESVASGVTNRYYLPEFDKNEFKTTKLRRFLSDTFEISPGDMGALFSSNDFDSDFDLFLSRIQESLNIDESTIPVIIWQGPKEQAPNVFVLVNQGGLRLNKYQTLAASFFDSQTDISSGRIYDEAMKVIQPSDGETVIEKSKSVSNLDLYGSLVGLSAELAKRFPFFFPGYVEEIFENGEDNENGTEEQNSKRAGTSRPQHFSAFNIVSLVCGLRLNLESMTQLPEKLTELVGLDNQENIQFSQVSNAVLKASEIVCGRLGAMAYSTRKGTPDIAHSELAFAALIASYSRELIDSKDEAALRGKAHAVVAHYILDVLNGIVETRGHATDAAAFDRVWKPFGEEGNDITLNNHYLTDISREIFEKSLEDWWEKQQEKTTSPDNQRRCRIDNDQRMVLKFYGSSKARWIDVQNAGADFHVDHSVPFSRIRNWALATGKTYASGSVANLAIIPAKLNLSRQDKTLDEYMDIPKNAQKFSSTDVYAFVPYKKDSLKIEREPVSPAKFDQMMLSIWTEIKSTLVRLAIR